MNLVNEVKNVILSNLKKSSDIKIGIEIENLIYNNKNDENNVDIPTHLLNGDYFICPVACGGDGSVQYTAIGTGDIDGTAFRFGFSLGVR